MMLHKLRRAMVNAVREPLHGELEVDDTWVGGEQAGLRGSRQLTRNVSPGSTIYTDALKIFAGLVEAGFKHIARMPAAPLGTAKRCEARCPPCRSSQLARGTADFAPFRSSERSGWNASDMFKTGLNETCET